MDEQRYYELMDKLERLIPINAHPLLLFKQNSPSFNPRSGVINPAGLIITKDMDITKLDSNNLVLLHTLLHKFYSTRSGRGLSKNSIVELHNLVIPKLRNHYVFDKLDKV